MKSKLKSFLSLAKASMKMYYRNKGAIIFTLLLPLALMSIFGFLSKGGGASKIKLGVVTYANNAMAIGFVEALKKAENFDVESMTDSTGLHALQKGNIDLQVIIPETFGTFKDSVPVASVIQTRYNKAKPYGGQIANMVIKEIASGFEKRITNAPTVLTLESEGVSSHEQNYFDFILPGLMSMTIMQLGIFGVAFSFVSLKASGALRRIQATPVHPIYFVFAQAVVRLLVISANITLLLTLGTIWFDFHMIGSYLTFALVAIFGILIFLGIGFAIAGWARDETQVAPVANLIQLPLLLLSGIFFSRDGFPAWLKSITDYFPLTYVSHGLRKVANEGATLTQIPTDLIGMLVWIIIVYTIAVRVFKWE